MKFVWGLIAGMILAALGGILALSGRAQSEPPRYMSDTASRPDGDIRRGPGSAQERSDRANQRLLDSCRIGTPEPCPPVVFESEPVSPCVRYPGMTAKCFGDVR